MGMAAGQARLLSITSRMSDNELRAQIINNNKMRLATESSQVSESYIAALNEAQLMFTNYDADNNASYQQLTYNALTNFNPYNNQYALINSSGAILLSEQDAQNFQKSNGDLETFLGLYGLKSTTTYFDNLAVDGNNNVVLNGSFSEINNTGFTKEALELMYFGTLDYDKTDIKEITFYNSDKSVTPDGYLITQNSDSMYQYLKYSQELEESSVVLEEAIIDVMRTKLNELIKNGGFGSDVKDAATLRSKINSQTTIDGVESIMQNLKTFMTGSFSTYDTKTGYVNDVVAYINNNIGKERRDVFTTSNYLLVTDGINNYIATKDDETGGIDGIMYMLTDNEVYDYNNETNAFDSVVANSTVTPAKDAKPARAYENLTSVPKDTTHKNDTTGTKVKLSNGKEMTFYICDKKLNDTNPFTLKMQNDLDSMKAAAIDAVNSIAKIGIYKYWDRKNSTWATNNIGVQAAQNAYTEAEENFIKCVFGVTNKNNKETLNIPDGFEISTYLNGKYDENGKLEEIGLGYLYNNFNSYFTNGQNGNTNFQQVFLNLMLDMVMDEYGEPNKTWIDKSNPNASYNENGEAKALWYENLFNRIKSGGYAVLQEGLASSPEWIQFAFESGIVTMEQIDSLNTWQPLIYTNCSDITSETPDKKIAIAEAEYNAAMNKIENKDKRYDLELKNIDTEHNSLQIEYESIKAAIDKNIERTFKLYS